MVKKKEKQSIYIKKKDVDDYYENKENGHGFLAIGLIVGTSWVLWLMYGESCGSESHDALGFVMKTIMFIGTILSLWYSIHCYGKAVDIKDQKIRGKKSI